ncbi:hypothetical protein IAF05_04030 [Dickeya dianthicola]|uniref:hypothetical protein n=1 Tax=Dickeya dianthicola TaxID=204039 RepID=UPI001BDE96B8|nr:hypothetical protein [Dickeya dianthicola]MBT1426895.1 hypothetical protein [Dickeya dianthicola]MBT1426898.1 hypothetical protein [Dickeya dianthicola]MBT1458417.1 hypothetical protein [Dickeya dianthicola]MBT1487554.1 hypothetical protein [Dickeya dianthicola]MBT1487557.1 hypothetical protein [Dickeya dianthicola]
MDREFEQSLIIERIAILARSAGLEGNDERDRQIALIWIAELALQLMTLQAA